MPNRSSRKKHIEPMDLHIGQQIKIARIARKMSQETLADAIGVTFQQVQKYEKGVNRVSGSRLHQIADALSTHVESFFRDGPKGKANDEPTNPGFRHVGDPPRRSDGRALAGTDGRGGAPSSIWPKAS